MQVYIKGIRFKRLDTDAVLAFLRKHHSVQVVAARACAGGLHAQHAVLQAEKAFRQKKNTARTRQLEFLVRLSGQRQIKKAVKACTPTANSVFVSWSPAAQRTFSEFKKQFAVAEVKIREPPPEKIKQALEKTATYWL